MRVAFVVLLLAAAAAAQEPEKLVVATKESPPFSMRDAQGRWTGISIDLWQRLATDLGLEYEYREMALDEMFPALAKGEVDVALAALSVTHEREKVVDFSHPYYETGLGVAAAPPGKRDFWSMLGRLFSIGFLLAVLGLVLVTVLVGTIFWLLERRREAEEGRRARQGIGDGMWWATVILLGHKGVTPKTVAARVLAVAGMITSLFALSTLTGVIASLLTVGRLEYPIQRPDDLRRVRVVTVSGSTSEEYLRRNRIDHDSVPALDEALDRVVAGSAQAVVYDAPLLKYRLRRSGLDLDVLPWSFRPQSYAIALPPRSALREPINRALLEYTDGQEWSDALYRYLGG